MSDSCTPETAARSTRVRGALRRFLDTPVVRPSSGSPSLRLGVERGMAATLAIVATLFLLLALPQFAADHRPDRFVLVVLSFVLAGTMVAALPLALIQRTGPLRAGLWIPVASYVGLLVLEPFTLRSPLSTGSTPWLLGLSLIAFSCTALAEARPLRAAVVCAGIDTALACAYAGRIPVSHSLVDLVGLGLLAAALIAGVRALRLRADEADDAEQRAQILFEDHQRHLATETERVHTDALLHDTVLAALLTAAGDHAPDRTTTLARSALDIVSSSTDNPFAKAVPTTLGMSWASAEEDLAAFRDAVEFDLDASADLRIPSDVAEALVAATVQALSNSVRHAGSSAARTATATRLDGGGLRITVSDDGIGFDFGTIPAERLGVRASILGRMQQVGASASIRTSPGTGTDVVLEWHPDRRETSPMRSPGESLLAVIPRRRLSQVLGVTIVIAVLIASTEALLVSHAYASVVSSVLGLITLPSLIRGARRGWMSNRAAWGTTAAGIALCSIASIGLDPADFDCVSICRYTCGVLAGAVMGWMAGRRLPPIITAVVLVISITRWAGPTGVIRLGLAAEIVIVVAGLLIHRALHKITEAAEIAADRHRDLTVRQAELDAFNGERQRRLQHAGLTAAPMLRRIVETRGALDDDARAECRVLEQALRDEIRGRSLLNDDVRRVVSAHRRRGALVQVLDDGGLDGIESATLDVLLDDVARRLEAVRSSRIVIRTGRPESGTVITIVASTPDETAVALGLDTDDEVDLWLTIPHPDRVGLAA